MTVTDVMIRLGVCERTVHRMIKDGRLRSMKFRGKLYFPIGAVSRLSRRGPYVGPRGGRPRLYSEEK